jgi:hypothetical protein
MDNLRPERPRIADLAVLFHLSLHSNSFLEGELWDFTLTIVNETDQELVLYFPREPVSIGHIGGTLQLRLLDERELFLTCGAIEVLDKAFVRENFIQLPPLSHCESEVSLDWRSVVCAPVEPPGPGRYTLWYRYENVLVGPEVGPMGEPGAWREVSDVEALLGLKDSNSVEFEIIRARGE